jgi:NAD(P)-dependent dehydrogenase (short-subunit alcohol dehydrogenase family)
MSMGASYLARRGVTSAGSRRYAAPMDPGGRIAVVTGAGGGIGGAVVRALLAAGASHVVAVDLQAPTGFPDGVEARALDVSDEAATRALADVEASTGPIDLWFANAGVAGGGSESAADEVWERQWQVNVMAHVYASRALLPRWLERQEGHLITTASMAGILTTLGDGVYAATKHAAVGFAEWMAITYGDQGIRVSCVCPGAVDTGMLVALSDGDAEKAAASIGGGDVLSPEAAAAEILAGTVEDRFLILTHPQMHEYVVRKAQDPERWIRGMRRLWARTQELLAG